MNIKIRYLKNNEIKKAVDIVKENYSKEDAKWARKELLGIFIKDKNKLNYSNALCAILDKKIVGFLMYSWSWVDNSIAELYWLNVLQEYQHKSIGRNLVKELIIRLKRIPKTNKYKPLLLISSRKNEVINRYKELGFEKICDISKSHSLVGVKL